MTIASGPEAPNQKLQADPALKGFTLEQSPFYLMTQATGLYTLIMERSLKAVGMDLPRWRVLMVLHEQSPSTVSEISRRSVMKLSTMTKVAQRLEKEGYVKLAPNRDDKRATDVHLRSRGEEAVEVIREAASQVYQQATRSFSDQEILSLNKLLTKLSEELRRSA